MIESSSVQNTDTLMKYITSAVVTFNLDCELRYSCCNSKLLDNGWWPARCLQPNCRSPAYIDVAGWLDGRRAVVTMCWLRV